MNPDDIEEGDDVYFECKVDANPKAYKVIWKHNVSDIFNMLYIKNQLPASINHYRFPFYMTIKVNILMFCIVD